MTFFLRSIGTVLGCLWGWAAVEAVQANYPARFLCAIFLSVGLIPSTYVQLGSNYPKAGQVAIISMCVVALSTELHTVPGQCTDLTLPLNSLSIPFTHSGVVIQNHCLVLH